MAVEILQDADLFALGAHTIVNPVNCQGVMGKGLAKAFADRFPEHLVWYRRQCVQGLIAPGRPQLDRGQRPWILAFPTKTAWSHPSRIEHIEAGLGAVVRRLPGSGVQSIAFPALGCGLGGLPWPQVRELMVDYLSRLDVPVWVIAPPERVETASAATPRPSAPRSRPERPAQLALAQGVRAAC